MLMMLDVVTNHMGICDIKTMRPFNSSSHYHDCKGVGKGFLALMLRVERRGCAGPHAGFQLELGALPSSQQAPFQAP
jgi:hypothetical protein